MVWGPKLQGDRIKRGWCLVRWRGVGLSMEAWDVPRGVNRLRVVFSVVSWASPGEGWKKIYTYKRTSSFP